MYEDGLRTSALLPTGAAALDWLLGGGIATGEVTEVIGPPGAGKTDLCLLACAAMAARGSGRALYVHAGGSFRAMRLYALLQQLLLLQPATAAPPTQPEPRLRVASDAKARLHGHVSAVASPDLSSLLHTLDRVNGALSGERRAGGGASGGGSSGGASGGEASGGWASGGGASGCVDGEMWRGLRLLVVDSVHAVLLAE